MKPRGSERRPDEAEAPAADAAREKAISATALGPADVRDTPHQRQSHRPDPPEAEKEEDPWIGRVLSNVYEIEAKIGEGGMGSVYLARHIHLQKSFAIKVLLTSIAGKDNAVERLKQEAMAAANIDHENIVDVVNFDRTSDGAVYIVMELLKGESLSETIARGPIEAHRALPITYQICRALHAAHEHGIVHRDLKPENVFLTEKGGRTLVKVLDFGISKIKKAESEQVRMTKTGQLVGTPLYMSPEQARGESEIDRRVDVYAMGVMLYEMLTGLPPFEGRNYFELLWKHGNEPAPSMKDINPNVYIPDGVDDAVLKALEKERDARFQTMEELEHALMEAAPDVPALAPTPSLPPERGAAPPSRPKSEKREKIGHAPTEAGTERVSPSSQRAASPPAPTGELTLPRTSPWPIAAVGLGVVLVLGAVGYAIFGADDPAPVSPPVADGVHDRDPAGDPATLGEPTVPAPPPGVDPPTVQRISVQLSSFPEGAEVRMGDAVLGTTPLVYPFEASDRPVRLTFVKDGYLDGLLSVVAVEGVEVPEVRLRRRRRPSNDSENGSDTPPIKTGL
jgi:serine/threonine-protein kinase